VKTLFPMFILRSVIRIDVVRFPWLLICISYHQLSKRFIVVSSLITLITCWISIHPPGVTNKQNNENHQVCLKWPKLQGVLLKCKKETLVWIVSWREIFFSLDSPTSVWKPSPSGTQFFTCGKLFFNEKLFELKWKSPY